jgi:hypothetical protein
MGRIMLVFTRRFLLKDKKGQSSKSSLKSISYLRTIKLFPNIQTFSHLSSKIPPEGQKMAVIQEGTCGIGNVLLIVSSGFLLKDKKGLLSRRDLWNGESNAY